MRSGKPLLLLCAGLISGLFTAIECLASEVDKKVEIDFDSCAPTWRRVDAAFGSITYEIVGTSREGCVMLVGGEVENPRWDGHLDKIYVIPVTLGRVVFESTGMGLNLSAIENYGTDIPRPEKKTSDH